MRWWRYTSASAPTNRHGSVIQIRPSQNGRSVKACYQSKNPGTVALRTDTANIQNGLEQGEARCARQIWNLTDWKPWKWARFVISRLWRPSKAMILNCHLAPILRLAVIQTVMFTLAASVMDFEKAAASLFL
jgi:hypothetical protein